MQSMKLNCLSSVALSPGVKSSGRVDACRGGTAAPSRSIRAVTPLSPKSEPAPSTAGEFVDCRFPVWKRVLDLTLVVLIAPFLALFFVAIAIYIKLVSRGPIFFTQERMGRRGRPFQCFKFRTMHADSDRGVHQRHLADLMHSQQPMRKLDSIGDSRVIPLGGFLRSSGLDELPQLINVCRGEMSVIGPRPCLR